LSTRIKICGVTRPEDGRCAAELGADAIGLVFFAGSPRHVDLDTAGRIIAALPPLAVVVALFQNPTAAEVERVVAELPVDLLQFHGSEPPEFCRSFGRRYLKALAMAEGRSQAQAQARRYPDAAGYLLDSHATGQQGGSGQVFDWSQIPASLSRPFLLAGGLHPENVADAIRQHRPYGVDVSSGVEAGKGIKDAVKMAAFISEVKRVENE
jgi:phosphoribosylanthranilate isomerase